MGNCVSRFQPARGTGQDHSAKKGGAASELPSCPVFPIQEPTQSFWTFPPSSIATHVSSDNFPTHADVGECSLFDNVRGYMLSHVPLIAIIGSGISGASFARTLLDIDQERNGSTDPLSVIMLEAQETCSGATGR